MKAHSTGDNALEGIPQVLWVNSRMLLMHGPRIRQEPHIVSDAMPDGFHYEPSSEAVTSIVNHMKAGAVREWLSRMKDEKG
jgi:hypothetical protein